MEKKRELLIICLFIETWLGLCGIFRPVWFLFFNTVIENTENTILMFSENCSCYLNIVFSVFYVFENKKKTRNQTCSLCFPCSPCFSEQKTIFKNYKQTYPFINPI